MNETEALENFAAGYLNQDWPDFFPDEWEALQAFLEREPEARVAIGSEIRWVLDTHPTEARTKAYLDQLGCGFRADWDGGTYRAWLEEVARRVEAATR